VAFSQRPITQAGQERAHLSSGVRVKVYMGGAWASGFEVFAAQPGGGYLLRRSSDRSLLPVTFFDTELRLDPIPLPAAGSWSPPPAA
jgi:hypothetical protein